MKLITFSAEAQTLPPHINVEEVKAYKWISIEELKSSLNTKPSIFTEWFLEIINKHFDEIVYGITSKQP